MHGSLSRSVYWRFSAESHLIVSAIFVGNAREWIPELIERAKGLKIAGGFEENADLSVTVHAWTDVR